MLSGSKAIDHAAHLKGKDPIYEQIYARLSEPGIPYEDQCSPRYYLDLVGVLHSLKGEYNRVAEVGVFMGGASAIFAGMIGHFDFDLDLIDVNPVFLQFTYSRVRRIYPEAASRVRLFHGNLPSYVKCVLTWESSAMCIVHVLIT